MPQQIYLDEAKARIHAALGAEIGFVERLVWFWSNHFCVSADKGNVRPICGAYEREAIRAACARPFRATCCLPSKSHPAMLIYLDNARSIGPDSHRRRCGRSAASTRISRAKSSSCIRLACARVYTQEDVTRFAKVITGWTMVPLRQDPARGGEFHSIRACMSRARRR